MAWMLPLSMGVGLVLLAAHCARERGPRKALWFFIAGTTYGIGRGNVVYYAYAHVKGCAPLNRPYVPQEGILPRVGEASLQVALGWVFALYLALTVAELVVQRLPRLRGRTFVVGALATVFMLTISYCMETVAGTAGWWRWTLPTRSALFGDVNASAMWAWFTAGFEFLTPFLVIHRDSPGRYWLLSLIFVPHVLGHLLLGHFPNAYVTHAAIALVVALLMLFSRRPMGSGELRSSGSPASRRLSAAFLAVPLILLFTVVTASSVLSGAPWEHLLTSLPMLMLCLLAWKRLPVWAVVVLSGLGASAGAWVGPRALYAFVPVACFGLLWLMDRLGEPRWLRLTLTATAVVVAALGIGWERVDEGRAAAYLAVWREGDARMRSGDRAAAVRAWEGAPRLRPQETFRMYEALQKASPTEGQTASAPDDDARERLSRLAVEYEELTRRDPNWPPPREELAQLRRRLDQTP